MRRILTLFILTVLVMTSAASAGEDPRLVMREGDDLVPYKDGQFFTRYTPWLKAYHPMTTEEVATGVHGGEACQQIRCIDISPADPNLVIFGTDTTGVWISTDGGDFWHNTHRNIFPTDMSDVFCHPTNKNIMLCYPISTKTGEDTAPGVYRSTDMGRSWTRVHKGYISSSVTDRLFAYDSSGNIYALTGKGVMKSTDDGSTWNELLSASDTNSSTNRAPAVSLKISSDEKKIAAAYSGSTFSLAGVHITSDGGKSWSKLTLPDGVTSVYAFEFDPLNSDRYVLAANTSTDGSYGLYVSSDSGESWTAFASAAAGSDSYNKVKSSSSIRRIRWTKDYLYVTYNGANDAFRYLAYDDVELAGNTSSWQRVNFSEDLAPIESWHSHSDMYYTQGVDIEGDTMFICAAGPYKHTFSTGEWERKSRGFSGIAVNDFNMDADGNLLISRVDGNIFESDSPYIQSSPATFKREKGSYLSTVGTKAIYDPFDSEGDRIIVWLGNANKIQENGIGVIISEDGGATYPNQYDSSTKVFTPLAKSPVSYNAKVLEYASDATKENATIYSSTHTSYNNGATWNVNDYFYLDICDTNGDKIIAWDIFGDSPTYNIMYSEDRGDSFAAICKIGTSVGSEVSAFFDAQDENIIWYKSQFDFGKIDVSAKATTSLASKVSYGAFSTLAQNPRHPRHLLLGLEALSEVYCPVLMESLDYGQSWHVVPGFFGRPTIRNDGSTITFSTTTDEVFLATLNGIMVYEYNNFAYYQAVVLKSSTGEERLTTYELSPEDTVTAPDEYFPVQNGFKFDGWEYRGTVYEPGEKIKIH